MVNLEPLLYFIRQREQVRVLKEAGVPPPWGADPILRTYRFCNVRRKDDRVSRWLREHVLREEHLKEYPESFLLFTALCRQVNWPPTIREIIDAGFWPNAQPDWDMIGQIIDARQHDGEKAWTGAYMVRADKTTADYGGKGRYIAIEVVAPMITHASFILNLARQGASRRDIWQVICDRHGWGSFMSGQVVDDWGWTSLLADAPDTYTWAPQGPGSARGFNRLMGRPLTARVPDEEWAEAIPQWLAAVTEQLGPEYDSLTAMDLQNCLCETDKMLRVKAGEGRPRATYRAETAY